MEDDMIRCVSGMIHSLVLLKVDRRSRATIKENPRVIEFRKKKSKKIGLDSVKLFPPRLN